MKAVVFHSFGEPAAVLTPGEIDVPDVGAGQVRVRMLASPINPSDLLTVRGQYAGAPKLPATPGYEGVGVIDKAGPGLVAFLRRFKPGQRVVVLNMRGGNWAEFVTVPAHHVVPTGDLPDAQAATFFVNPATAWVMTREVLRVRRGQWLLQTAAGSALGGMVRSLAEMHGFGVVNIVRRSEQAEEMRRAGMTAFSTDLQNIVGEVAKLTKGKGVPFAIDAVGGETGTAAANCLGPGGRMLLYGLLSGEPIAVDPRRLIVNQGKVEGFLLSEWALQQSIPKMLSLFRRLQKLIGQGLIKTKVQEFPLARIKDAVTEAERPGRTEKVLLRIST